jgi:hypothetical protein
MAALYVTKWLYPPLFEQPYCSRYSSQKSLQKRAFRMGILRHLNRWNTLCKRLSQATGEPHFRMGLLDGPTPLFCSTQPHRPLPGRGLAERPIRLARIAASSLDAPQTSTFPPPSGLSARARLVRQSTIAERSRRLLLSLLEPQRSMEARTCRSGFAIMQYRAPVSEPVHGFERPVGRIMLSSRKYFDSPDIVAAPVLVGCGRFN